MFAAIPSPSTSSIQIGVFELRAYGLTIAIGALLAVWVSSRRYEAAGGDPVMIHRMATWAIPAGIIGRVFTTSPLTSVDSKATGMRSQNFGKADLGYGVQSLRVR